MNAIDFIDVQWRCFVRSTSTTHVILTLLPATLKDVKCLLLQLENMDSIHKTRSSRYIDFVDTEQCVQPPEGGELSNSADPCSTPAPQTPSLISASNFSHSSLICQSCQGSRKRVRAFSGGECAPAIKRYLADGDCAIGHHHHHHHHHHHDNVCGSNLQVPTDSSSGDPIRSQTFSEGTVSGKLAHFVRAKRAHSEQAAGTGSGGGGVELEQEISCCSQVNYFLQQSPSIGGGVGGSDDSLRHVPFRSPIIGSLGLSLFTFSCSLLSLTEHVIFKKLSRDEMIKDFRLNKGDPVGPSVPQEFGADEDNEDDDEEDLSSGSGTIFPNGRSISQESFSESSLQ